MTLEITPSGQACGAEIRGVDLSAPLPAEIVAGIRAAWLEHQVLSFPDQSMSDADLERFTLYFGPFGEDPFIASIPGHQHIIAVQRAADETAPIFAESWHTDWSFQAAPPSGTCLFGITIPPRGGDTLFANQYLALEQMPTELRERLDGKKAIHSAKNAYAPDGMYGEADKASGRSMTIIASTEAQATQMHDIIRVHPETGRESVFGTAGYITGFEGMAPDEGWELLAELYRWQTRPEFQYRHVWQENMLVMWDNRCLLHMATGGYPGHARLLHRTTIGAA
ncbi:MAG: taurine dioxygenase [Hyphomonas sp.]|mgnify:FL=1|nr:taurine dioxygenase [Hyphomonas sp.]|tara:strand:+ start:421 stop:1263 length:843 start_codon:yes stop_codon:yes gene_type:complete